ncbi:MAG TPA: NIL domain-containing protein [Chloroflexota bacterium]
MGVRRVKLSFPGELIREPIIYQLGQKFPIVTNIRRADVTGTYGWVVLEIEGDEESIRQALDWAGEMGVRVDPVLGDLIEG